MSSVQVPDFLLTNVFWQIISDQLFPTNNFRPIISCHGFVLVLIFCCVSQNKDEFGKIWLILTNWNELKR